MICAHQGPASKGHCAIEAPHCGFCGGASPNGLAHRECRESACPACSRPSGMTPGELCGRDDCPGEAQREKTTDFGPVPEPRERVWEKTTGLRVGGQKVEIIG